MLRFMEEWLPFGGSGAERSASEFDGIIMKRQLRQFYKSFVLNRPFLIRKICSNRELSESDTQQFRLNIVFNLKEYSFQSKMQTIRLLFYESLNQILVLLLIIILLQSRLHALIYYDWCATRLLQFALRCNKRQFLSADHYHQIV